MTSEQMGLTSISINLVQVKKMSLLVFAHVREQSSLIPTLLQCYTSMCVILNRWQCPWSKISICWLLSRWPGWLHLIHLAISPQSMRLSVELEDKWLRMFLAVFHRINYIITEKTAWDFSTLDKLLLLMKTRLPKTLIRTLLFGR